MIGLHHRHIRTHQNRRTRKDQGHSAMKMDVQRNVGKRGSSIVAKKARIRIVNINHSIKYDQDNLDYAIDQDDLYDSPAIESSYSKTSIKQNSSLV